MTGFLPYVWKGSTGVARGGSALARLGSEAGRNLHSADAAFRSAAGSRLAGFRWDPVAREAGRIFRTSALKVAGRALPFVGAGISIYSNFTEEGNDPYTAGVESTIEIGAGLGAGLAIGAVCAATAGIGCLVAGAGIAIGAGLLGGAVGEAVGEPVGNIIEGAVGGVGDFFGGLFGG